MSIGLLVRLLICVFFTALHLYLYIDKQNDLTELCLQIPQLKKELQIINEENTHLKYEIDCFENPQHLLKLARLQEFSHLKHPAIHEILTVPKGIALDERSNQRADKKPSFFKQPSLVVGAKH